MVMVMVMVMRLGCLGIDRLYAYSMVMNGP